MANRGPIYKEKDTDANKELSVQLYDAVRYLDEKMQATSPIHKGTDHIIGYGVNKAQRGIAADAVISIARAIKALRGW